MLNTLRIFLSIFRLHLDSYFCHPFNSWNKTFQHFETVHQRHLSLPLVAINTFIFPSKSQVQAKLIHDQSKANLSNQFQHMLRWKGSYTTNKLIDKHWNECPVLTETMTSHETGNPMQITVLLLPNTFCWINERYISCVSV